MTKLKKLLVSIFDKYAVAYELILYPAALVVGIIIALLMRI